MRSAKSVSFGVVIALVLGIVVYSTAKTSATPHAVLTTPPLPSNADQRTQCTIVNASTHVKTVTISEPYGEDTTIGKCVLRAMKAIIVPAYQGSEQVINWEIDLTGGKKSGPVGGAAAEDGAGDKK